ncbi:Dihydrodipicolinate synthase [Scheffersomyces xylosifermentans]|uniref:Dihydrodipicolinate synthase n=1 Tax=Scheffersomyces xylosifermentans TaxID=1304137 RepID=UPI00315D7B1F
MTVAQSSILPAGIYTPITTFFKNDDDYTLDLEAQVQHTQFLYNNGISGLVVAGSMGETPHLSQKERHDLVAALRKGVPDKSFKLIAGAPPMGSIDEAVAESESASDAGADFIILLIPGYFGSSLISQEGIIDYFSRVADKSALPVIIYNYPGTTNNVSITYDTYKKLSTHPNIVAVKLTHFNLDLYTLLGKDHELCETNNFRPFTGLGQVLLPAMSVGIYGAIDGMSALFPKVMVKLYTLIREEKYKEASELQYLVTRADMMIMELNVVGVKHALKQFYNFGECLTGRPPLSKSVDLEAYAKHEANLKVLDKLEKSLK